MSLLAFQRVMAALAASPELCRRVKADAASALAEYELTPVELRRLASVAGQKGMAVNCTLHRSNRISTTLTFLPGTVHLLGKDLRRVADLFWKDFPSPDFTTRRELRRFGAWLVRGVEAGTVTAPFLAEVVGWELAQYELGMMSRKRTLARLAAEAERGADGPPALHPLVRLATFRHDPAVLLGLMARREPLPWDVPEGEFYLLLDVRSGRQVEPLDVETGRALTAVSRGQAVDADDLDALLAEGYVVRTASTPAAVPALAGAA